MNNNRVITIFIIISIVLAILGGTLAYWSWASTNEEKTNVTFTIGANFSCSADGGGTITNTNYFVPTDCTNSTYAIKREITTNITSQGSDPVYMDMWLNIDSIGSGLSNSQNLKYALTTSSSSCTTGVYVSGNFNGKVANDKIQLLDDVSCAGTYYLYVWLDAAETSTSTMNQSVSLSLGGECTDHNQYVYTGNVYDWETYSESPNDVLIGRPIPSTVTQYSSPEDAMAAIIAAGSEPDDYTPFLRHKIGDGTLWCAVNGNEKNCVYESQAECNSEVTTDWGSNYSCQSQTFTNGVMESYVGFMMLPGIETLYSGANAGTYYLKGGDNGRAYNDNVITLYRAFGSANCSASTNYHGSNGIECLTSDLSAKVYMDGYIIFYGGMGYNCTLTKEGSSLCEADN